MNLSLNDDQLKTVISGAVLQAITPESRDKLLSEALSSLLKAGSSDYDKKSPLQRAFDHAIADIAREMVTKQFSEDQAVRQKVGDLVAEAVTRVLDGDREKIVKKMSESLTNWLHGDSY